MALQSSGEIKMSQVKAEFGGTNPISMGQYRDAAGKPTGEIKMSDFYGKSAYTPYGDHIVTYSQSGEISWAVPGGVTEIHILCIGAGGEGGFDVYGGGGGGSGSLGYINNVPVTPGETLKLKVGKGGQGSYVASRRDGINGEGRMSKIVMALLPALRTEGWAAGVETSDDMARTKEEPVLTGGLVGLLFNRVGVWELLVVRLRRLGR